MILTDFYLFRHLPETNTKGRVDCCASTCSYPPFEELRNQKGELFVYIGDNTHTRAGQKGKSDLAFTKTKHISSIYRPDITNNLGFGDVNHTTDALLFVFTNFSITNGRLSDGATIEIFVARGYRDNRHNLYTMFADGDLNDEVEALRQKAQKQKAI